MTDPWMEQPVSFPLSAKDRAQNQEQSAFRSALSLASCRRSEALSSVAPILRTSVLSVSRLAIHPSRWGHLYFAELGDISILH